jgi:ABC-type glycerol-3-phosphate transport system permease component
VRLAAGDIVMFPQGDPHVISSAPDLRPEPQDTAWMITTAFKPAHEIFVSPPVFFPGTYTVDNVVHLFQQTRFATYLANSVLVASSTVALTLAVAVPGAYGLTRYRFRGREASSATILFTYMFAPIMIIIRSAPTLTSS